MFCFFTCMYYTLRGWTYNTKYLDVILYIGVICGLLQFMIYFGNKLKGVLIILPFIILILYRWNLGGDTRLVVSILAVFMAQSQNLWDLGFLT